MNIKKTALSAGIAAVIGISATGVVQAAAVANGDALSITTGVYSFDAYGNPNGVASGSYFAMDFDGNSRIVGGEMTLLSQGSTGIIIGAAGTPGSHHPGAPTAGDSGAIDAPWFFSSSTGTHYTTNGITGDTTTGLDFSGWNVAWSTITAIPMTTGAWTATTGKGYLGPTTNGKAIFSWDGNYGNAYTLDYHATVPPGDPSNFGGIQYEVHYEGLVTIPVPAAVWLFGSGLLGLAGVARRRKVTQV